MRNRPSLALVAALLGAPLQAEIALTAEIKAAPGAVAASFGAPLRSASPSLAFTLAVGAVPSLPLPSFIAAPSVLSPAAVLVPAAVPVAAQRPSPLATSWILPSAVVESAKTSDGAILDDSATAAFARIYEEHPKLAALFESWIRQSRYAQAVPVDSWKRDVPAIMGPMLDVRAEQLAMTADGYRQFLASDGESSRAERAGLAGLLNARSSHETEGRTAFFRDHPIWKAPLEKYLDGLVAERRETRALNLQSVGAGYGVESYALAISADQALRRAGENPASWRVTVGAYDLSFMSLVTAARGLLLLDPADHGVMRGLGLETYFEPAAGGLLRLKAPLRDWISPAYVDLDDARFHGIVTRSPADVVFANYTLFHLRLKAAAALADHWLSGSWAARGFLSIAHVLLAEVGSSPLSPAPLTDVGLLRRFAANVGSDGRLRHGDDLKVYVRPIDFWRRARSGAVRAALSRGAAFAASLSGDPFFTADADPRAVEYLRKLARERGLNIVLTTEDIPARADRKNRTLLLNVGWALAGGAEIETLKSIAEREVKAMRPVPEGAVGSVSGTTVEGAALKLETEAGRPVLRWLTSRVVPITDDYRSHNAARGDAPAEIKPSAQSAPPTKKAAAGTGLSRGNIVTGLY